VNSDAAPDLLQRFGIQSIPTLMLVRHGREIARQSGVMPACRGRQGRIGSATSPPQPFRSPDSRSIDGRVTPVNFRVQ
jgi:hypothetical protein